MLLNKTAIIKWHPINKKWYEDKKYHYTKMGDEFEVKIEDLTDGSSAEVNVKCDCKDCKNPYLIPMPWYRYLLYVKEDGKYYCNKCAKKLYANESIRKTKLNNSKSFFDWCYENLSKEEADKIMLRWDYELNIDKYENKLSPKDVCFSSNGFDKKGYWFKCLEHFEHKSELKNINTFTSGIGSIKCIRCNTISITHSNYICFLVNKKDAYKYSYGSREKILMKCPNCGHEKKMSLNTLINSGFGCKKCGDGVSFCEKFMFNLLEQLLNKDFQTQLSKTTFKWCLKFKYDFYINKINTIIETHGIQHYEGGFDKIKSTKHIKTLEEEQNNDEKKENLAIKNGIDNYIILDCRYSELNWIKNSILNSELPILLNFKEEDIDWLKCHEYACNSLVKEVCNLWNNGIKSTKEIGELLKKGNTAIVKYLKQGAILGWCDYDPKQCLYKEVICLNTNEVFNGVIEASKKCNIIKTSIYKCCKGWQKSAGNLPDGTKLKWMYYEEYLKTVS